VAVPDFVVGMRGPNVAVANVADTLAAVVFVENVVEVPANVPVIVCAKLSD